MTNDDLKRFEGWLSGLREMGQDSRSHRVFVCQAENFQEACLKFIEKYPAYKERWDPETHRCGWQQKLFSSKKQADAYLQPS
jgi:hypothetical protein